MRLSLSAKSHIRRRTTPEEAQAIRDLAESKRPAVREVFFAMREAVDGFDDTLQALSGGFAVLHDPQLYDRAMKALEIELPAVLHVLSGYAMLDAEERYGTLVKAWNRGPDAVRGFLVNHMAMGMLCGMIVERARWEQ